MFSDLLDKAALTICNQWAWWWEVRNEKDELAPAIRTVSIVVLAIFWYLWTFVRPRTGIAPLPPGPYGLPIVGYLPFLGTNLHQSFAQIAHQYGPIFKLGLGSKLCVVLSSPSLAKEVRDQDMSFANRDPPIAALAVTYGGLDILWSPYGSYWRTMRKIFVREMLSNSNLEACYSFRRNEVQQTIRDVSAKIGKQVNIGEITFLTEINVIMSMLWGSNLEGEKSTAVGAEFREVVSKITELMGKPNISDFFPVLSRFDIQGVEQQMKRLLQWVEQILDPIIDERMKMETNKGENRFQNDGKKDFLQTLLELKLQEDNATPITLTQIKALLMDIVVGGTDTTATMVELVMAEIMYNPEVMKKAQEELAEVVGMNNIVEESHLPKLQYLDAVVKETFRLHPALPLLVPRCPSQTCTVGGYTIPKGTRVFLNIWAMQRDPQVWDDPSHFKPERFLNDPGKWNYTGNNCQYLPFGFGRRICAGLPLAEKMIMYMLASLLHSFEWQLPKADDSDLSEKFGIVIRKSKPLIVIPTQRLSGLELCK